MGAVQFRIHAYTQELTLSAVREVLGLDERGSLVAQDHISESYLDEDEGIAGVRFSELPPFADLEEQRRWGSPEFRNAEDWLRGKSPDQVKALLRVGLRADLCVAGYSGHVPATLLRELDRLSLELYIVDMGGSAQSHPGKWLLEHGTSKEFVTTEAQLRGWLGHLPSDDDPSLLLVHDSGDHLFVAMKGPLACVIFRPGSRSLPYLAASVSKGGQLPEKEYVEFEVGGTETPVPRNLCIPVDLMVEIVLFYFRNERLPGWVSWIEDRPG